MIAILLANLAPLVGVVFFGWDAFAVVVLYWFENVVIGVLNVVKMICCCPPADGPIAAAAAGTDQTQPLQLLGKEMALGKEVGAAIPAWASHAVKLFIVPFFVVHYGMFTFVHGAFVFTLFGGKGFATAGPFKPGNLEALTILPI